MIFCVEDDPNIRELEVYTLQSVGFKALGVGSGDELFKALECGKPTLILRTSCSRVKMALVC